MTAAAERFLHSLGQAISSYTLYAEGHQAREEAIARTFGALQGNVGGQVFALFVITIAAAEVGVGLAIVLLIYRNRRSVDLDQVDLMKG